MKRIFAALFLSIIATGSWACGPDSDCMLGDRHYRIAMPEGHDGAKAVGAVVFAHGYRGNARGIMRNTNVRKMLSERGLALISLKSLDEDWVIPKSPSHFDSDGADEFSYIGAVLDDAIARFAIDPERVMFTGFSAGGMMVWNAACAMPDRFAGFAPVAGTFWLEPPKQCAEPVASVVHIHGTEDRTVPLGGRPIRQTHQGDIFEVLEMYRAFGGFGDAVERTEGDLSCQTRRNQNAELLEFCTFEGGHSFRRGFITFAWDELVKAGQIPQG